MGIGFRAAGAFAAALAMLLAAPASAQQTRIEVAANATWAHQEAKLGMPPTIDGQLRDALVDNGNQRLDVIATYRDRPTGTTTTLYLYRVAVPDVSLWHDRALLAIRPHEALGTPDHAAARTATFAPPRSPVASGLRTVMPLNGGPASATGLALFAQGPWLVKVRMSSRDLDMGQLEARLAAFVAALPLEPLAEPQVPAAVMTECTANLRFTNAERAAVPEPGALVSVAMGMPAIVESALREAGAAMPAARPSQPFCRETVEPLYGVYRRDGEEGYVMGFGDAGISARVGPQVTSLAELEAGPSGDFWITLSTRDTIGFYRGFRTLPRPAQVFEVISREPVLASVVRNADGKNQVNLTTNPSSAAQNP